MIINNCNVPFLLLQHTFTQTHTSHYICKEAIVPIVMDFIEVVMDEKVALDVPINYSEIAFLHL